MWGILGLPIIFYIIIIIFYLLTERDTEKKGTRHGYILCLDFVLEIWNASSGDASCSPRIVVLYMYEYTLVADKGRKWLTNREGHGTRAGTKK